jgi:hypothetical protein
MFIFTTAAHIYITHTNFLVKKLINSREQRSLISELALALVTIKNI